MGPAVPALFLALLLLPSTSRAQATKGVPTGSAMSGANTDACYDWDCHATCGSSCPPGFSAGVLTGLALVNQSLSISVSADSSFSGGYTDNISGAGASANPTVEVLANVAWNAMIDAESNVSFSLSWTNLVNNINDRAEVHVSGTCGDVEAVYAGPRSDGQEAVGGPATCGVFSPGAVGLIVDGIPYRRIATVSVSATAGTSAKSVPFGRSARVSGEARYIFKVRGWILNYDSGGGPGYVRTPMPFVFTVFDNDTSLPAVGVPVSFSLVSAPSGGEDAAVMASDAVTGPDGKITATFLLGSAPGPYLARASCPACKGNPTLNFGAFASAVTRTPKVSISPYYSWAAGNSSGGAGDGGGDGVGVCGGVGADPPSGNASTPGAAFWLPEATPALRFAPRHSSLAPSASRFGFGWQGEPERSIVVDEAGRLTWTDSAGTVRAFLPPLRSSFTAGTHYIMPLNTYTRAQAGSYGQGNLPSSLRLTEKDGTAVDYALLPGTRLLLPSRLEDRNGNPVQYQRDAYGKLTRLADVHGRFLELGYDGSGRVRSVSDSAGRRHEYAYDAQGNRVSEADANGDVTGYQYDAGHRITQIAYPNGGKRYYAYDGQGRVLTESDDDGDNARSYAYYPAHTVATDSLNRPTVYRFKKKQGLRKVTAIEDPLSGVTSFGYDSNMNLAVQTDSLGRSTTFQHDAEGNVTAVIDALQGRADISYEPAFNQPALVTDARRNTTAMTYDAKGNLVLVRDPLLNEAAMTYDPQGHVATVRDALNQLTSFGYNGIGGLASVTDPLDRTTQMARDAAGRVALNTDPKGKATAFAYDQMGNLTRVTDALNGVTTYDYIPGRPGRLLGKVVDARQNSLQSGKGTVFGYDLLARLTSVTNALNQPKTFTYDTEGNLRTAADAMGRSITFQYDALNRLTTKTLPPTHSDPGGVVAYAYDAVGNPTVITRFNGSVIEQAYDALDRVIQTKQTLPNGFQAAISYAYDANGNKTSMATPWGTFAYAYDELNRQLSITNPQGRTFAFSYDAAGRRTRLTYPNGTETTYSHDPAGQLRQIFHRKLVDGSTVALANYGYDPAGNRTSMEDAAGVHAYGYDDLHRLTGANHPPGSNVATKNEAFAYDPVGNRLSDALMSGYQHDAANRLLENSLYAYQHDANGNMTSASAKLTGRTTSYAYDGISTWRGRAWSRSRARCATR